MQTKPEAKSKLHPIFFAFCICRFQMSLIGRNMTNQSYQHEHLETERGDMLDMPGIPIRLVTVSIAYAK